MRKETLTFGLIVGTRGVFSSELARIGRQMEIGEQRLLRTQLQAFVGLRFLDLDDQLRPREDFFRAISQFGAGGGLAGIPIPQLVTGTVPRC